MARTDKIAKNAEFAILSQAFLILTNFVVRRVFVMTLGEEYLGLNGLFADILSMLSLAELGFGTAIVYSLYKPLAKGDKEKIKALMSLYGKAYRLVGCFVLTAGLSLTPFLSFFVKEMPDGIPHIEWIYALNVLNSGASYFFIYKASLLFADQKKYIEMLINVVVKTLAAILQVAVLLITGNYFIYLGIMIASTFGQNLLVSAQVDRMYPYLKEKKTAALPQEDKTVIRKNVGAMVFHKLGYVAVFSTDSILMAKFVSVAVVGLYSNYMLIRKALINVIDLFFVSLAASMGNLNACETDEKKYEAYSHIYFLSAWLFGFMSVCLYYLFNPFITLWLGEDYLLPSGTVGIIVLNFYMYCMRMPVNNTKEAMGLFWNDRYKPLVEVAVNLGASILLAQWFGIDGVLWGTLLSTLTVPFLVEPYVLYKHGLHRRIRNYYLKYIQYFAITLIAAAFTGAACRFTSGNWQGFLLKMLFCTVIPNLTYLAAYGRSEDFSYVWATAVRLLKGRKRGGNIV